MLWGDGFEIETVLNCRVAASGLKITEVPSMERERIFGQSNLRTFADGTRVLRTLAAERRRAQQHRSEKVKLEETSRALTPPGGFPAITPEVLAAAEAADGDVAAAVLRPAAGQFGTPANGTNGTTGHAPLGHGPAAATLSAGVAPTGTDGSPNGLQHGTGTGAHGTNGAAAIGQHDVPRIPVRRPGGEV
jgi:hypothetical protein